MFSVAAAAAYLAFAGSSSSVQPRVEGVVVRNLIVLHERISAGTEPIIIPNCAAPNEEELALCELGVRVEVKSGDTWIRAPLDPTIGSVPGGYPVEQQPVRVIEPGTAVEFTFTIDKMDYLFKRGQEVRLRIYSWISEESMRSHGPKQELVTPPFQAW